MSLTRDQILAANDRPVEYIDIPKWGGQVRVRAALVGHPRLVAAVNKRLKSQEEPSPDEKLKRAYVYTAIMCAVDENDEPLFKWEDADALREKNWRSVMAVADKAWELARFEDEAVESIDEGKGSSENDQTSD